MNGRDRVRRFIVTMGWSGLLPAPGTFGSLITCLILLAIFVIAPKSVPWQWSIELAGILLFSALAVALGDWGTRHFGTKDPGGFVLDEAAGICLTMLFLPPAAGLLLAKILLSAFVAFRVFDISKPPPARQLERLPAGWGILLDDLAAAIYANILCQLLWRWMMHA